MKTEQEIENIARVCHEANRAYCLSIFDNSQADWDSAPEWQRQSAINGVQYLIDNPEAKPEDSHNSWWKQKIADGWNYGPIKDVDAKTHPCMRPYQDLPDDQKRKDALFTLIVKALS